MLVEAIVGGCAAWCLIKSGAAGRIRNIISDFRQGYSDEKSAQASVEEDHDFTQAQAAYDYVLRDLVSKASIQELQVIIDLFSRYGPPPK